MAPLGTVVLCCGPQNAVVVGHGLVFRELGSVNKRTNEYLCIWGPDDSGDLCGGVLSYCRTISHRLVTQKPTRKKPEHAEISLEMFSVIQRQLVIITHRKF
jgi:hypothetical protein